MNFSFERPCSYYLIIINLRVIYFMIRLILAPQIWVIARHPQTPQPLGDHWSITCLPQALRALWYQARLTPYIPRTPC